MFLFQLSYLNIFLSSLSSCILKLSFSPFSYSFFLPKGLIVQEQELFSLLSLMYLFLYYIFICPYLSSPHTGIHFLKHLSCLTFSFVRWDNQNNVTPLQFFHSSDSVQILLDEGTIIMYSIPHEISLLPYKMIHVLPYI